MFDTGSTHRPVATSLRRTLRELPVFSGDLPEFEPGEAPVDPVELFTDWLYEAVAEGVAEPHAVVLSTVDPEGRPSARVLICKDVQSPGTWFFASSSRGRKGQQIETSTAVALTFYWPTRGRQVRVEGHARSAGLEASASDFLARPVVSRAGGLTDRQSDILRDPSDIDDALATALARLERDPDLVAPSWTLYAVTALHVEFWQADQQRHHVRLRYHRVAEAEPWTRDRLWP